MAVVDQPTEQPTTDKTRAILEAISKLETKLDDLQDVGEAVREIRQSLNGNDNWKTAIIRALNQFLSHVDPNWKKHNN